jgi:hypothetical protein
VALRQFIQGKQVVSDPSAAPSTAGKLRASE